MDLNALFVHCPCQLRLHDLPNGLDQTLTTSDDLFHTLFALLAKYGLTRAPLSASGPTVVGLSFGRILSELSDNRVVRQVQVVENNVEVPFA